MWLYCFPLVSLIWYVIDIYPTSHENLFCCFELSRPESGKRSASASSAPVGRSLSPVRTTAARSEAQPTAAAVSLVRR